MSGARAVAAAVVVGLAAAPAAAQDWAPGKQFAAAATRVFGDLDRFTAGTSYGFADGSCFLSAFLVKGEDIFFTREFTAGVKYAVVGGGDDGVRDLDLVILDDKEGEVAKDALTDSRPVVEFTPPRTGRYRIRVVMADAGPAGGFGTVAVLSAGGHQMPARDRAAALAGLLDECGAVNRRVTERVFFSSGADRWAVYGALVRPGVDLTVTMAPPGGGRHMWVTAADPTADGIDTFLCNEGMKVLVSDERAAARPLLEYVTEPRTKYAIQVRNARSRGPALVLTATLSLQ